MRVIPPSGCITMLVRLPLASPTAACPSSCAMSDRKTIGPQRSTPCRPPPSPGRTALRTNPSSTRTRKRRGPTAAEEVVAERLAGSTVSATAVAR